MTDQNKTPSAREFALHKVNNARSNLLLMIALTAVNLVLLALDSQSMLLFSASIPYFAVVFGMVSGIQVLLAAGIAVAVVSLLVYLLCWLLSKKHYVWMIVALVLFSLDTLAMAGIYLSMGDFSGIMDMLIHIWVLYYLIIGVKYGRQLLTLPEEPSETAGETEPCVLPDAEAVTDAESVSNAASAQVVEATSDADSVPLREADKEVKHRMLAEANSFGHYICYRRVKRVNELVIDGKVYAEYVALVEFAHALQARVDGHVIQVGYDGTHSYIRVDGEQIARKFRIY